MGCEALGKMTKRELCSKCGVRKPDCTHAYCPWTAHAPDAPRYTCPRCGAVSFNANDLRERYCGRCRQWETP